MLVELLLAPKHNPLKQGLKLPWSLSFFKTIVSLQSIIH